MSEHAYPPAPSAMDGGYFAAPVPAQPIGGYGMPSGGAGGWSAAPAPRTGGDVPAWVVVVATVLVLTGAAAGWLGLTMVVTLDAIGAVGAGEGVLVRALLLLLNAAANLVLAHQLLRGAEQARWLVSGLCGWWVVYWLWKTSQLGELTGSAAASPFGSGLGQVGTMLTLGLLLLSGLAAGTAGLLWTSSAGRHFTGR